jgi:hypothetical protein
MPKRKLNFDIALRKGEEIERLVRAAMATSPEIIAKASAMMQGSGK